MEHPRNLFIVLTLAMGLLLGLLTLSASPIQADDEPTAVDLIAFDVVPQDNAVLVTWETATEVDTAGFRIERGDGNSFTIIADFISGRGSPASGDTYDYTDSTVSNGEEYVYRLIEITTSNAQEVIGSETVTVGIPPTATSAVIGGGGSGGSSQPTNTPQPQATNTPQPTSQALPTSTPQPTAVSSTATPRPTTPPVSQPTNTVVPIPEEISVTIEPEPTVPLTTNEQQGGVPVAFAQEEATATPNGAYPAATASPAFNQPIVGDAAASPYPDGANSPASNGETAIIGGGDAAQAGYVPANNGVAAVPAAQPEVGGTTGRDAVLGTTYLWGGFIAALLIFGTAVFGSIVLFTRRQRTE